MARTSMTSRKPTSSKTDYKSLASVGKSTSFFSTAAYKGTAKKASATKKTVTAAQKSAAKSLPPYKTLIIEAIRATQKPVKGSSIVAIHTYLDKKYPGKSDHAQIRMALRSGVANGTFKKTKASYRVAAGVAKKKRSSKKKAASSSADASTTTKKATKKKSSGTKKASTKTTTKKATPAKRAAAVVKKARATPAKRGGATASTSTYGENLERLFNTKKSAKVFDNSTAAPEVSGVIWQYQDGSWKNYDKGASDVVEAAYQEWKANPYTDVRAIKSGQWEYQVDFTNMAQTNIQHEAHTRRKIRRTTGGGVQE